MLRRLIPLLIVFLITPFTLSAQEGEHPPQFLYRNGDQLVLVSITGDTSETLNLPHIVAGERDIFLWSPDGRYLLALVVPQEETYLKCMNLYDIAQLQWLYDMPIACDVAEAVFSHDSATIAYSMSVGNNERLRLYTILANHARFITQTADGDAVFHAYIHDLRWSPTDQYLSWEESHDMMGGGRSTLVVRDNSTGFTFRITGGSGYYADYDPIWSPSGEEFLLHVQDEYVTSGTIPLTNHRGDVYLINAATGAQYRITYSPAEEERNLRWTADGQIAFDVTVTQTIDISIEQAENIPEPAVIVTPEPFDTVAMAVELRQVLQAEGYDAWVWRNVESYSPDFPNQLNIGTLEITEYRVYEHIVYSVALPADYHYLNIIIGWRPTATGDS